MPPFGGPAGLTGRTFVFLPAAVLLTGVRPRGLTCGFDVEPGDSDGRGFGLPRNWFLNVRAARTLALKLETVLVIALTPRVTLVIFLKRLLRLFIVNSITQQRLLQSSSTDTGMLLHILRLRHLRPS